MSPKFCLIVHPSPERRFRARLSMGSTKGGLGKPGLFLGLRGLGRACSDQTPLGLSSSGHLAGLVVFFHVVWTVPMAVILVPASADRTGLSTTNIQTEQRVGH